MVRRDSDITLVNSPKDDGGSTAAEAQSENANALRTLAQEMFKGLLAQLALDTRSIPSSTCRDKGTYGLGMGVGSPTEAMSYLDLTFPIPNCAECVGTQMRKSSFGGKGRNNVLPALGRSITHPSDRSMESTSCGGSVYTQMKDSTSEMSRSPTLTQIFCSDCISSDNEGKRVLKDEVSLNSLDEELHRHVDKGKGAELLQIIRRGTGDAFETLLKSNASLEEKDQKGKTPLILAASLDKVEFIEKLLKYGADVQAVDKNRATALHNAIESSSWSAMSLLLNSKDYKPVASVEGDLKSIINKPDKNGRTPLHCCTYAACAEDDMERVARELITCGANVDAKDKADLPPVYYAIKNRRDSAVQLFLEVGAGLEFVRPETSPAIAMLLDDHIAGKSPSPRGGSIKCPKKKRKGSVFALKQKSGTKT